MSIEKIPITKKDELFDEDLYKDKHLVSEGAEPKQDQQVTYEQNGNTITVQSTKVIGEYNYSFVSVSPTYAPSLS